MLKTYGKMVKHIRSMNKAGKEIINKHKEEAIPNFKLNQKEIDEDRMVTSILL